MNLTRATFTRAGLTEVFLQAWKFSPRTSRVAKLRLQTGKPMHVAPVARAELESGEVTTVTATLV